MDPRLRGVRLSDACFLSIFIDHSVIIKGMKKVLENRLLVYILLGVGVICLVAAVYFSGRTIFFLTHKPPHFTRATDTSLIQDWMNPAYISRMYKVPKSVLYENLGLKPDQDRTPLKNLAKEIGKDPSELVQTIRNIVSSFQSAHPLPSASNNVFQ